MTSYPNALRACFAASLLWLPSLPAASAPEEIQVYQDDSVGAGRFGLDLHNSYVVSGAQIADYSGGVAPNHQYRLTPEFYYGLTSTIELGLYVLSDRDASGRTAIGGEKVRIKYIAPRPEGRDWYWGVNLEVGRVGARYDQNPWNTELKGIWGWRRGRWDVAVNANVDAALSGRKPPPPSLEITTKVGYRTAPDLSFGVETFDTLGDRRNFGRFSQNEQAIYAVSDFKLRGFDLNLGVGRGLTAPSDHWVVKAVIGVPLP